MSGNSDEGPIANRPQDNILPHKKFGLWLVVSVRA
jgi:hypothetical protein